MKSITKIFEEVVHNVSEKYGYNVSYLFGDAGYITNILTLWSSSEESCKKKYPVICLYSPFDEDRTDLERTASLEFIIMVNTLKDYTNEDRERTSFEQVLRPIYDLFIAEINNHAGIDKKYNGIVPHIYTENYRYGRLGILGYDGKPFQDFIDAIEIKNMNLIFKEKKCYGNRY